MHASQANLVMFHFVLYVTLHAVCVSSVDPAQDLINYQKEKFSKKLNKIMLENLVVELPHKHWKANYCFQFSSFMHFINT